MKQITATIDEKTLRPVIDIQGDWVGKEIKMVIKMFPRSYRIYKADRIKKLSLKAKGDKEDGRVKGTKREGSAQPAA